MHRKLVSLLIACGVVCAGTLIALSWKGSQAEHERVATGARPPAAPAPTSPSPAAAQIPASAVPQTPVASDPVTLPGPTGRVPGEIEAWGVAKHFVKAALASPSSASFGDTSKQSPNCGLIDDSWSCSGWVDAKNSAGATQRNTFIIAIKWTGKGDRADPRSWSIVAAPQLTVP